MTSRAIELLPPASFQGGKQRNAPKIVECFPESIDTFYDLCCGSGAVSLYLVDRKFVEPQNLVMADVGVWGLFWKQIGEGSFDLDLFDDFVDDAPDDPALIQDYLVELSELPADQDTAEIYILLQAGAFGSKQIYIQNNKWKNTFFRRYWEPTSTSNRQSPVNPMMPMPEEVRRRVHAIAESMCGVTGFYDNIYNVPIAPSGNTVAYIDPPYEGLTGYADKFDVADYARSVADQGIDCFVSEAVALIDHAYTISGKREKGGISGYRSSPNEEWLSYFPKV